MYKVSTNRLFATLSIWLTVCTVSSSAFAQQPANSKVVLKESFEQAELGDQWTISKGKWDLADGVLTGTEQAKDKHSAVIEYKAETGNTVYEFKFLFSKKTESLDFDFAPANDDADSSKSLFSLTITPNAWYLAKDNDGSSPKNSEPIIIARQDKEFQVDRWYTARVTTWGPFVTAKIDQRSTLTGSAQKFATRKAAIMLRVSGGPVQIDEIHIWTQR